MLEKLIELLEEKLDVDGSKITADTSFKDDLGADSLDLLEVIMEVEDEKGVKLNTDALKNIKTLGDLMAYLESEGIEL